MTARFYCFGGQSEYFGGFWDGVFDGFFGNEGKRRFELGFVRDGHRERFDAVVWGSEAGPVLVPEPEPLPFPWG